MQGMNSYTQAAMERAMKVQEVMLQADQIRCHERPNGRKCVENDSGWAAAADTTS